MGNVRGNTIDGKRKKRRRAKDEYQGKYVNLRCDKCGKEFKQASKVLHLDPDTQIIVEGFRCPKCKKEYIVIVSNNVLRDLLARVRESRELYMEQSKLKSNELNYYREREMSPPSFVVERWEKKLVPLFEEYQKLELQAKEMGTKLKQDYLQNK